ncbi:helix-turn-helix domain-containing protein [Micromonospora sp. NPDC050686]|uniref:ATP-binding protein n=1 Tax=Micromonospora sp. NPDC050686 TaxID=3154631 RepID=UPI0034067732
MGDAFAVLLRHHRLNRRLTQEALAEQAGISSRSIGGMERGTGRGPRPHTLEQLATALKLAGAERGEFVNAGRALFLANRVGRSSHRALPADVPAAGVPPRQLPANIPDFVGRGDEVTLLRKVLDPTAPGTRVAVISGPPGVGKSALAVHAAHRFAHQFPDGNLYASLRGATAKPADPADVLAQLLRLLGVDGSFLPSGVDPRAGLFRARLAGRRVLLVLDDADGYRQIEPLLPPDGAAVLVTSRLPLTALPGVAAIDLRPLPGPTGLELLGRVAGVERVRAEPAAATELVTACGGLPLAVRIVAARLAARPHWTVRTLADRLADDRRRLDELRHGDLAVRPGLQMAYRTITPVAARAFALLGALGIPSFPAWPVARLMDIGPAEGLTALDELLDAQLLDDLGPDQAGQPRYGLHDLTQLYARERCDADVSQAEWLAALSRVADGWLALARQAQDRLHCERLHLDDGADPVPIANQRAVAVAASRPVEWFESERDPLAMLVQTCAAAGLTATARRLAGCSADFYELRGYYDDWRRSMESALVACRQAGDDAGEAAMLRGLGSCLIELDDLDGAVSALRRARALAEEIGDPVGAALARKDTGFAMGLAGLLEEAEAELRGAAEELGRVSRNPNRALALASLGFVLRQRGDTTAAVDHIRSALAIARACGDRFTQAYALRVLAGALLASGQAAEAERAARRAVRLFQQIDDPIGAAQSQRALGEALVQDPGRLAEAEQALTAAEDIFREREHRWGLALTELSLGEIGVRVDAAGAVERLRRSLQYWIEREVPALQARALVALAAAEDADSPNTRELLMEAYQLYQDLKVPAAAELGIRLGLVTDQDSAQDR